MEHNAGTYEAARTAYAAYLSSTGGKNYQGDPCPAWDDLPQGVRDAWGTVVSIFVAGWPTTEAAKFALGGDPAKVKIFAQYRG